MLPRNVTMSGVVRPVDTLSSGVVTPSVPILAARSPHMRQICRVISTVEDLPFVPVTATMNVVNKETKEVTAKEVTLTKDEGNRADTTLEGLKSLKAVIGDSDALVDEYKTGVLIREFDKEHYRSAVSEISSLVELPETMARCRTVASELFDLYTVGAER